MSYSSRSFSGFTLVELSIVLVIIGLIIGGVLVGQDMIQAAKRRAIISEYERIQTTIAVFRDKYNCMPGDCNVATQFFDVDSNGCPAGGGATGTCNGDGDGRIEYNTATRESFRAWQQLSLANLWPGGPYTGIEGPNGIADSVINANVPSSKWSGAGWTFYDLTNPWGSYSFGKNGVIFGTEPAGNAGTWGSATSPVDAKNIDTKVDDGISIQSGRMFCGTVGAGLCVTSAVTGDYNTTTNTIRCSCLFALNL